SASVSASPVAATDVSPGRRKDAARSSRRSAYAAAFTGKTARAGGKGPHRARKRRGAETEAGDRTSAGGRQAVQSTEERVPGQHEPRNSHADERRHWHDGPGAGDQLDHRTRSEERRVGKECRER